ncbi:unnamed protein product [Cylindrotheca closterium]|uniref:tRNA-5-taurinomethyluridine 2-sulfurtransferase n=1 Tax=Cylindrotheca closterium TaxID=2856 RepID=A0AAD2G8W4_9STRA|nr:unnamed protein product [Cylindrotheca closterium]
MNPLLFTSAFLKSQVPGASSLHQRHLPPSSCSYERHCRYVGNRIFLSNEDAELCTEGQETVEQIQQRLAQLGMSWKQEIDFHNEEFRSIDKKDSKVPGCVATVHVWAIGDDDSGLVSVRGNSDAIVSKGLLNLLSQHLSTKTVEQVLALDPSTITDQLGVREALSQGRNDGIANMLQVIQKQLSSSPESSLLEETADAAPSTNHQKTTVNGQAKRVALLLSGGVDSSVALHLLLQQGYSVTPFYLKIWLEDELAHLGECPWEDDVDNCQQVCDHAGVELEIISLQDQYHERVMQHTLNEAAQGRTPNPDILCNSRVKFGCFLDYLADERTGEFDFIASGHYAQVQRTKEASPLNQADGDEEDSETVRLRRAPDPVKDQSYFLCALQQFQLQKLLFPIGHLEKWQVRELAEEFQLPNRHRPDSQGLCFLGKVKFSDFLNIHLGEKEGDIIDAFSGEAIGRHKGVWYHTVGQRKGIGRSLFPLATAKGPWYVVAKDPKKNVVYASNQYDEEIFTQSRSEFHVENIHWIAGEPPSNDGDGMTFQFDMKIRHGPRLVVGSLELLEDNDGIIKLAQKDGGLAPGQYVVFYHSDDANCLGGGIISERHWAKFLLDAKERRTSDVDPFSKSNISRPLKELSARGMHFYSRKTPQSIL